MGKMKSRIEVTVLLAVTIFIVEIDYGYSETASSYSNQFHGSSYGYNYPQKYSSSKSGSNEILSDVSLSKLLNYMRKQQALIAEKNQNKHDLIFDHSQSDEGNEEEFSYGENDRYGPRKWGEISAQCDGRSQSPIAINVREAIVNQNSEPLKIDNLDIVPESINVENNGHSLKLSFTFPRNHKIKFTGGPLKTPHILDNVHFHWGYNTSGSEHVINGKRYAAELHMVTYNSIYANLQQAVTQSDGLAVLGIVYDIDKFYSEKDNSWTKFISKVIKAHSTYTETNYLFPLRDLIKDNELRGLLSYQGSLTTPGCSENVLWMLSTRPILIKQNELYELSKLRNAKGRRLLENYRPLQAINGRQITAYRF